ncbi:hypothetical protein KFK09_000279 [Dendrobium nobile]|uniref:Orn/Lys/Arg decarboxylases family 1 pyridoxal-P attachment site domain-containing protein n=1 Tax=Dendrobium nobile TaxID=94219 RepID=A0A8T3C8F7_DENNO|nr:hypothetical protein KFK09_000279 [Dendrobium nobile]
MISLPLESLCGISRLKNFSVSAVRDGNFRGQRRLKTFVSTANIATSRKQDSTAPSSERIEDAATYLTYPPKVSHSTTAPLVDALRTCAKEDVACFHFPGHNRGKAAPPSLESITGISTFLHDLPELPKLDDLFSPKGVILDAQRKAAGLFGALETWFLVGGTTCGIQASIMATCAPGETLILPRNSHISATTGLVLSGASPKYIMPEYSSDWDIPGGITPSQVKQAIEDLAAESKTAAAVLLTSPTYHGICSNISEITSLCHSYGIPVIVDEAHGAHFRFHCDFPSTALQQGADLAVQSTHKVLTSLTQSSMLHLSGNLIDRDSVSRCLQMLQSSSPNYLLLASLDAARAQLSENPNTIFISSLNLAIKAKKELGEISGISVLDLSCFSSLFPAIDPLRITVGVSKLGISGYRADDILCDELKIISELVGCKSVTFAVNLGTTKEQIQILLSGLRHLSSVFYGAKGLEYSKRTRISAPFTDIIIGLSPRDAFFSKKRKVVMEESIGKICGELISSYPPGIPVLVPGEVVTKEAIFYLLEMKRMGAAISGAADHELSLLTICDL